MGGLVRPVHHRLWRMQGQSARACGDANVRSDPPPHTPTLHSRHGFILCPLKSVGARDAVILVKLRGKHPYNIIDISLQNTISPISHVSDTLPFRHGISTMSATALAEMRVFEISRSS